MTENLNEVPRTTPNFNTEAAAKLAELFPEVVADGKVNFDVLKTLLDVDVEDTRERFGLTWPGKRDSIRAAQTPTTATLIPDKENSVDWDTTQNIFIEGDNLEVLKVLQKHYYGKIKMIYIDPPYNTGNDFVYADDYADSIGNYLELTGQTDEGGKLSTNSESAGRFHSNWLNMMYPRLKLAKNLLTHDGIIFISIDGNEKANLKLLCDEIFGENNFQGEIAWLNNMAGRQIGRSGTAKTYESLLLYSRQESSAPMLTVDRKFAQALMPIMYKGIVKELMVDDKGEFDKGDTLWNHNRIFNEETRPNLVFSIFFNTETGDIQVGDVGDFRPGYIEIQPHPNGDGVHSFHAWRWSKEKVLSEKDDLLVQKLSSGKWEIYTKLRDNSRTNLKDAMIGVSNGTAELVKLFDGRKYFDYPKSVDLIRLLVDSLDCRDHIILDFFAGSGTTAHAAMQLNAKDGGNRRCISVQLPEPTDEKSEAYKAGYETITQISRERIRRAGRKILEEEASKLDSREEPLDVGFRAYKLADTNFAKWKADSGLSEGELANLFSGLSDSANDLARPEALVAEVLLKLGFSLSEKIEPIKVDGLEVFSVSDGLLLAYLDEHQTPTLDQLRALVAEEPERLVILEDAFQGDDELKTNLVQECRSHNIDLWTA